MASSTPSSCAIGATTSSGDADTMNTLWPQVWWARIRFPRPGAWTISWANWGALDSPCAPTLRVRVR